MNFVEALHRDKGYIGAEVHQLLNCARYGSEAPKERKTIAQGNALGKSPNGLKPWRGGTAAAHG